MSKLNLRKELENAINNSPTPLKFSVSNIDSTLKVFTNDTEEWLFTVAYDSDAKSYFFVIDLEPNYTVSFLFATRYLEIHDNCIWTAVDDFRLPNALKSLFEAMTDLDG